MTRATSALVLAVLLGTVCVRLGCAWSCQPSPVSAEAEHCHEAPTASPELRTASACDDVRLGRALFAATIRPDAAAALPDHAISLWTATPQQGTPDIRALAHLHAPPPRGFAVPLRQ